MKKLVAIALSLFALSAFAVAKEYDLLLQGGRLEDPANGKQGIFDIAIKNGRIAAVEASLSPANASKTISLVGLEVTPGLIDMHTHVFFGVTPDGYLSNSFCAVPPDYFALRTGVTTVVDAGGAGWRSLDVFKSQVVQTQKTRVLAFVNIVGAGMRGGKFEQDTGDMDAAKTAETVREHADFTVGIKLAHFEGPSWEPALRALAAARLSQTRVMFDVGFSDPPLSLPELFLNKMQPGDIYTHMFVDLDRRMKLVGAQGQVEPFAWAAKKRGVVMDIGHGGASFALSQARPALAQRFFPDTISSDVHCGSINGAMQDLPRVMAKLMALGMTWSQVVAATTASPAKVLGRPGLGSLKVGAEADVSVFRLRRGVVGFVDVNQVRFTGEQEIVPELTLRAGHVVWDLNGIAAAPSQLKVRPKDF